MSTPGDICVTGTITCYFFDRELYDDFVRRAAEETQARKAFLERMTGLPVQIIDPTEEA